MSTPCCPREGLSTPVYQPVLLLSIPASKRLSIVLVYIYICINTIVLVLCRIAWINPANLLSYSIHPKIRVIGVVSRSFITRNLKFWASRHDLLCVSTSSLFAFLAQCHAYISKRGCNLVDWKHRELSTPQRSPDVETKVGVFSKHRHFTRWYGIWLVSNQNISLPSVVSSAAGEAGPKLLCLITTNTCWTSARDCSWLEVIAGHTEETMK